MDDDYIVLDDVRSMDYDTDDEIEKEDLPEKDDDLLKKDGDLLASSGGTGDAATSAPQTVLLSADLERGGWRNLLSRTKLGLLRVLFLSPELGFGSA